MRADGYDPAIPALTSLRYVAAAWVVCYHFVHFTAAAALIGHPLVAAGYLGVDFFFVLSGFILTHVYQRQIDLGRFDYWSFISRRFARIYPLHLLTLVLAAGIGLLAQVGDIELSRWVSGVMLPGTPAPVLFRAFLANLTMTHAWGSTPWLMFNQPSWSISAEWFAYLLFPVFIMLHRIGPRRPGAKLVMAAGLLLGLALAYSAGTGGDLTKLTWNVGILRILPEFFLGIALYRFGSVWSAGARGAMAGLLVSLGGCVATLFAIAARPDIAGLLGAVAVLGLAGIVLFAADASRNAHLRWTSRPFPILLGEISYSVYMIHLVSGIVLFDLLLPGWKPAAVLPAAASVLAGLAIVTLLSWASFRWIEVPARIWLLDQARRLNRQKPSLKDAAVA